MKKKVTTYNVINLLVILLATAMFIFEYYDVLNLFKGRSLNHIIIIVLAAFIVHFIKASRLYFTLYDSNIDVLTYAKIYCKVTPVSVMFPFKIGDFFRMYCYGTKLEHTLKGIITIILDRFMDTIALLTIIFLVVLFNDGHINAFTYILFLFLLLVLLIYFVYPGVYKFWKKYILKNRATENNISILKTLDIFNNVYLEITNISQGRGIILYFMSLISWGCEIGCILLLGGITEERQLNESITDYLTAAITKSSSIELQQFIFISVVMMLAAYVIITLCEITLRKKAL